MADKRIIKRYTNRKLYDKLESRYVTLEEIARLVRAGEDIQVIDNETEEDLTAVTFAQIILEEEKRKTNLISVPFLRRLIRTGEARVQDLSERATRSIEALGEMTEKAGEVVREAVGGGGKTLGDRLSLLDDLLDIPQKRLDALRETARRSVGKLRANPVVRKELERITTSLRTLEDAIARVAEEEKEESGQPSTASDSGTVSSATPAADETSGKAAAGTSQSAAPAGGEGQTPAEPATGAQEGSGEEVEGKREVS